MNILRFQEIKRGCVGVTVYNSEEERNSRRNEGRRLLSSFSPKQALLFTWICAVRVLPFLSCEQEFNYLEKPNKQQYLLSLFCAIDIASAFTLNNFNTSQIINTASSSAKNVKSVSTSAVATTAATTYGTAVAYAFYDSIQDESATYATAAATAIIDAAINAFVTIVGDTNISENIKSIIFNDIDSIEKNSECQLNNDVSIYGQIWHDFLKVLKELDCVYWSNLYENLFANGFVVVESELRRRFNVPDETREQGAAAVGIYLENLGEDVAQLNEARIIILGDKGAGKTSLARKLLDINADLPREQESTEGVITSLWKFRGNDGRDMSAYIWDFAGHSITHSTYRCFMTTRCLYIYVYNGRIERNNDPAYWLEQIRIYGGDSPVLFLINEQDNCRADIPKNSLKKEYPFIVDYYHVNIANENSIKEFRQTVMDLVRFNVSWNSQIISVEAYKIKAELRKLFEDNTTHITLHMFSEIASKYGVSSARSEAILEDLHTLGVCLWYSKDDLGDFNTLILNPDWIMSGIYRIINAGYNEQRSSITIDYGVMKLKEHNYEYPPAKVKDLFRLMRIYELAYFKGSNTERIYIPGLLQEDMPDNLPEFPDDECLVMCFEVKKSLPPNIICRVIVQRNDEILDDKFLWRKGVVLRSDKYNDSTTALIQEDDRRITVAVKGRSRTDYIVVIRNTLKNIFDDYTGINPDIKYKVLLAGEAKEALRRNMQQEPSEMELESKIVALALTNNKYVLPSTRIAVSITPTMIAYNINMNCSVLDMTHKTTRASNSISALISVIFAVISIIITVVATVIALFSLPTEQREDSPPGTEINMEFYDSN
ncbi:MAG: hypothetical protein FWB96_06990 [Defluviitaleaceae bacterium]|nr:hypothetical protein [Defluviitaleaceae bacterium]MCL2262986.1 hypothetical protein [Defluviitaleaceae bacterium]